VFSFQAFFGCKEVASFFQASGCHGIDQDVDICGMIDMSVSKDDGIQSGNIDGRFRFGTANESSGTGIEDDIMAIEIKEGTSGRSQLFSDDEASAGCSEEFDVIGITHVSQQLNQSFDWGIKFNGFSL
jgi:hypothetical protein